MRNLRAVALILPLAALTGCSAKTGEQQAAAPECAPTEAVPAPSATLDGHAGVYTLTLVATSGEKSGATAMGKLRLHAQEGELRSYGVAGADPDPNILISLYGAAEVDLEAVGAFHAGALDALDPAQPGVMAVERSGESQGRATKEIVLRLGAAANRRDVQAFDGAYMALWVSAVSDVGFAGSWRSGMFAQQARGYFCAVRVGDVEG
jgi:hypothetical protein